MSNGTFVAGDMLRLIGTMAICVGLAWAAQVLGVGGGTAFSQLMWVLGAAAIAGAGAGSLFTASQMREEEIPVRH